MNPVNSDEIREKVRKQYGAVARGVTGSCSPGCCGPNPTASRALGYSEEELAAAPEGSDLGLGCGNPQAIAALREGERALDLGSGAGFDCFLAARQVGPRGRVIGVDMTSDMIARARENQAKLGLDHVEFRLGEIERLPVADASIDVILSNCVLNLSPDKPAVLREAFRVLAPGGRLAISDVVLTQPLPAALAVDWAALTGCVAGAARQDELERWLVDAGFSEARVTPKPESREFIRDWLPGSGAEKYVVSATIEAIKPKLAAESCCAPSCCGSGSAA